MRALVLLCLAGCYQSFEVTDDAGSPPTDAPTCTAPGPICVRPNGDDPCGEPWVLEPTCDPATHVWRCPVSTRVLVRATDGDPPVCRPFHDPSMGLQLLAGSLVRVPLTDGRCLWVADSVTPRAGGEVANVGFLPDLTAPFEACPARADILGGTLGSSVVVEGSGGPGLIVQITGGYLAGGATHVLYRLFQLDAGSGFGVRELGSGVGRWDAVRQRIVVPGPEALRWDPTLDLGDAYLAADDTTYVWGCPGPPMGLTESCVLGRLDAADAMQLWSTSGTWITSTAATDARMELTAGPWISSMRAAGGTLHHYYAVGFGTDLQTHVASSPEGPWMDSSVLAHCDLPSTDSHAYCAGPVAHLELVDPFDRNLVMTYGVGTRGGADLIASHPDDYWTRLVWLRAP